MSEPEARPVIDFYSTRGDYGCFSNFYRATIRVGGKNWATTEHYFQAQKFAGTEHEGMVRQAKTPGEAASLGRRRDFPLRRDWEKVKDNVMLEALRAKFGQHPDLAEILVGTGDAELVEHTDRDSYWGDGGDGSGRNRLGVLLMQVRDELRAQAGSPNYLQ